MIESKKPALTGKDIASIMREIKLGATLLEACGGCEPTRKQFTYSVGKNPRLKEIYSEVREVRRNRRIKERATL